MKGFIHTGNTPNILLIIRVSIIFITIVDPSLIFSQLSFELTSNSSTCENNGSITATITYGEGPFNFEIASDTGRISLNTSNEAGFTWNSLAPR